MTLNLDISELWQDQAASFSPKGQFQLAYIEPPPALAALITTFYIFHSSDSIIRDVQPAGIGHVMFFLKGWGQARFHDGHIDDSHDVSLICPSNAAMQYIVNGPFHCFGCALTPLGWRSLTGATADAMMDQLRNGAEFASINFESLLDSLRQIDDAFVDTEDDAALCDLGKRLMVLAAPKLADCFQPVSSQLAHRVAKVAAWLEADFSPKIEELSNVLALSDRQVQRFVTDNFGCSPKFLARKYRALRVAMALSDPRTAQAQKSALYDLFYDQSHMIREIRHFVGKTPSGLAHEDKGLLQMWLDPDNIRELTGAKRTQ
jgi:AraC-like DNA-binding protein